MRVNKFGQYALLKRTKSDHGGELRKKRSGRSSRPIALKHSMHLVIRSTQATGAKSFKRHEKLIDAIISKFARKHHLKILSVANVGNHLHAHLQLSSRQGYKAFIRAVTGAIALKVGGRKLTKRFWDHRPFTRIVIRFADARRLRRYIEITQLEGLGIGRTMANAIVDFSPS